MLNQVWRRSIDPTKHGASIKPTNRMIFVNRQKVSLSGEATKIMDPSRGAFLKQRMFPIEAVLVNVPPEFGLVMSVENLELELRDTGFDGVA